jgi:hypothetical protein
MKKVLMFAAIVIVMKLFSHHLRYDLISWSVWREEEGEENIINIET